MLLRILFDISMTNATKPEAITPVNIEEAAASSGLNDSIITHGTEIIAIRARQIKMFPIGLKARQKYLM